MAFILLGVGAVAVGTVAVGYLSQVPQLIKNAIQFKHEDKMVMKIEELQKGDHIIFKRSGPGPSHHAIVVDVNVAENKYTIIHFTSLQTCTGGSSKSATSKNDAVIKEEVKKFHTDKITLRVYKERVRKGLDRDAIVGRAYTILMKKDKVDYNALTNNCEHVASWCMFGFSKSEQIDKVMAMLGPIGMFGKLVENISRLRRSGDPAK